MSIVKTESRVESMTVQESMFADFREVAASKGLEFCYSQDSGFFVVYSQDIDALSDILWAIQTLIGLEHTLSKTVKEKR
jgi:hypothetical protein